MPASRASARLAAVLTLLLALAVIHVSAPAEAAGPLVRVPGTETWHPTLEVALDEVALLWKGDSKRSAAPTPTLVPGTRMLRLGRDTAAIRVTGASTLTDLVAQARALRDANPEWDARLVLYTPGIKRSARTRRLLTDEIVVQRADGSAATEHVADPLDTLEIARTIAARPDVTTAEPLAQAPDYLRQRLARKLAKLQRQDKASERQEFFALKRLPPGERRIPVERYFNAREAMKHMPLRSTAAGGIGFPSLSQLRMSAHTAAAFLGSWTPLGPGNVGGRTRALVIDPSDPSVLYAGGVAGGVWKTTDGGASWAPLTDTLLPNLAIASLEIDPTNSAVLYAGTGEGVFNGDAVRGAGIFKTADAGSTWTQLAATATDDFNFVNKVKVLGNGSTVLAATRTGLWRSQDGGTTWSRLVDANAVSGCLDIAAGDSYVLASCGTFAQGTVYRSASAVAADGFPFTAVLGSGGKLDSSMGRTSLAIAPSDPTIVYALATSIAGGTFNQGLRAVYKSMDRGVTWQTTVTNTSAKPVNRLLLTNPIYATSCFMGDSIEFFNQGWYDNVIAVDPADPNRVWAGGIDLFRSDNGGVDWGLASFWWTDSDPPGAFAHADQHAIVFDPGYDGDANQTMFVGNDGGIFKTTAARGTTTTNVCTPNTFPRPLTGRWIELNNGYGVTQFYHGLPFGGPDGGNTFFGGTQDNGTVLGTVGAGIDGWTTINGGDGGYVAVDPTNPSVLYSEGTDLSIAKSTDGGANFQDATAGIGNSGFLFIVPFVMSPNNPQILWTGGAQMWRTTNAAGSWTAASAPLGCGSVSAIAVAPRAGQADDSAVDQVVLAGTSGGCVFRTRTALSATGGTAWTRITTVGSGYVSWITFDPTNANNVYLTHSTFGSVHVERSVDGGLTFSALDGTGSPLPDVPVHTIVVAPGNPNLLYIGTDVGVFSSDDAGDTWSVENTGFANVITEALAVGQVGGVDHVFAFTHGRGVFRVALPASMADIAVVQVSVPNATPVLAGRTLDVTETVKNVGTVPASSSLTVGYALVPVNAAGTPTGPDIALAESRAVSVLSGQASSQATTPLAMPNVPAGSYKIRVIADAAGQVTEDPVPQNNNRRSNAFTIVRPDLMVVSVTPAPTAAPGGPLNVTHVLRNLAPSPAHAPSTTSTFHLATNQSMSTVIGVLGSTTAPPVTAGATTAPIPGLANVVPIGTAPGRYFVIVQANSTGTFEEITTTNNFMAASAPVLVGTDLLVTAASATPTGVVPGGNLSVTFTAKNQGGAAATFDVGFDLVPVTATGVPTGGGDVPLGTSGQAIVLNAGQTSAAQTKIIALSPSLPIGTYKLRVTADPGNAVGEADETNNTFLVPAIITVAKPDLIVPSVTFAPIATATNGSVTVTHVVKNRGVAPGHAPASTSRLFLGSVNNSVAGAFDLGTVAVGALTAGATQSVSRIVAMPAGITPGLYFTLAVADDAGVVTESDENNNLGASLTRLIVGPDLVVSAATTSTGTSPGSTLPLIHTIANRGGNAAGPFTVAFSLVPVTTAGVPTGAPEIPVGPARSSVMVAANSAGASFVSSVLIPADVNPGTYRVKITADSGNVVVEADEANNTGQTGILTIARGNLAVQSVTFTPPASRENGSVTVTHVLRNLASAPATVVPTISSLFLSATGNTSGLLFLGNVSAPQIVGGGTASLVKPVTIPLGTPPGPYFVVARADAGEAVIEGDESNSLASLTRLIIGPDLTVSGATAGAGVASGMNLSVSYTVRNAGGAAATNFDVAFFLVPVTPAGAPTGGPEVEVGPRRQVLSLAAGAMQAFTNSVLIPADTLAGTFKIRVSVDAGGTVAEASESNNELLTGIVKVGRPDLTVPSVTFTPAAVASGGTINVTHVVKNVTTLNGNAPASQSAIYLSQNASFEGALGPALALVPAPPLASSGMTTLLRAVDVGSLSTGRYFFVVRADDPGALIEQDENNNIGISATALIVGPDAAVTAATTVAAGAGPGTNVSVSYTLKNLGVTATGTFDVAFDVTPVTPGGVPNGAPVPLGTVRSTTLGAGQTVTFVNNALLPFDLTPGPYRIGVSLVGFATPDADPTNNTRLSNTVTVVRPDLVMSVFTPPAALIVGRTIGITNTVKNNATASGTAGPFGVGVYISSTGSSDTTGDTLIGNRSLTGLVGGGTSAVPVTITAPSTTGNFFLKAFADFTNVVVEANESNNVTVRPVAVVPDLTAGRITPITADISFNINGSPPTCLLTVIGSGTTSQKITTQTGGSFSGGQMQFADAVNGGAINTVNFSGTVSSTGDVLGTFTLSRAGGGGGSGSGSLTGTAFVGSPGALTLQLFGNFIVSGAGTCTLTATVTFLGSGPLTSPSVVPATLTAGDTGNVTIGFTTSAPWPGDGMLEITFPAGFSPGGAQVVSTTGPSGALSMFNLVGQTLRLERTGGALFLPGSVSIMLGGITNPLGSGITGTSLLRTTTHLLQPLNSGTAPAVTIAPGALGGSPSVTPSSLVTGASGRVTVSFDTGHNWPSDGTVKITFPAGFDVSGATFVGAFAPPGAFAISVSGQTVTLTRSEDSVFAGTVLLTLDGIRNPAVAGTTGTFSIATTVTGGATIDTATAPAVVISPPGALVNPTVTPASLVAGAITDVDVSFGTTNAWPGDGRLTVEFPAGFDVSRANFVSQTGPDGFFVVEISGQVVTVRRLAGTSFAGSVSLTLGTIQNPATPGLTGNFPLATTTSAADPIDSGTAPGVTLTP